VIINDGQFRKIYYFQLFVIPAQAGIQEIMTVTNTLDTRFRGYDDFLQLHQWVAKQAKKKGLSPQDRPFSFSQKVAVYT